MFSYILFIDTLLNYLQEMVETNFEMDFLNFFHSVVCQVIPIYVGEISPERVRGRLLSLLNTYAAIGFLVSSLV